MFLSDKKRQLTYSLSYDSHAKKHHPKTIITEINERYHSLPQITLDTNHHQVNQLIAVI